MPESSITTLSAPCYHRADIHRLELERIFARAWIPVARAAKLASPGQFVTASVAGKPVLLVRGHDGELRGFHNVCRHRAAPVATQASGCRDFLRCPYHGWVYDLDGKLRQASGFETRPDIDGLYPVRAALWNGLAFACLDPDAPALEDWLGEIASIARDYPPVESLAFHSCVRREGEANWKTYADNSAEGYHVALVHPGLHRAIGEATVEVAAHPHGEFVGFDVRYEGASDVRHGRAFWIYKFPGMLLHFGGDGINFEWVEPLGPGRLRLVRWFWFAADAGFDTDAAVADSRQVMGEDLAVCEAVQRNLGSGVYARGVLSPAREPGTIYVQQLVREALGGDPGLA